MSDLFGDLVFFTGLASLGVGVWAIHPPSALIVVGAILIALSLLGALRNGISKSDPPQE